MEILRRLADIAIAGRGRARPPSSLLPPSGGEERRRSLKREDGVSLNQWIVAAVAQKIGAVEAAETFLRERAAGAVEGDLARYLDRAPDAPPGPGDGLPPGE